MNKSSSRAWFSALLALAAAGLFLASLKLPLWHLKMEAPQYQDKEALRVQVYPGSLGGDLKEITVLNQYIGVRIPQQMPELTWLHWTLLASGLVGIAACALPLRFRRPWLFTASALLACALVVCAAKAQWQMRDIGHHRAPHPALAGVGDFTPPLLGKVKIANFEITTWLGIGALLIATGIGLQVSAGLLSRNPAPPTARLQKPLAAI